MIIVSQQNHRSGKIRGVGVGRGHRRLCSHASSSLPCADWRANRGRAPFEGAIPGSHGVSAMRCVLSFDNARGLAVSNPELAGFGTGRLYSGMGSTLAAYFSEP